ncbi:hypothetical protein [Pseudonocardia spinosispora]|uniref:hypothetical protein n=1 Tax=Pseudonocardia spinosispora TaxID=103441 RepID=UPI00041E98AA|nr:hypothetical protein [Pseudonocardia spinosispora]
MKKIKLKDLKPGMVLVGNQIGPFFDGETNTVAKVTKTPGGKYRVTDVDGLSSPEWPATFVFHVR